MSWLRVHNLSIDWQHKRVNFTLEYCLQECLCHKDEHIISSLEELPLLFQAFSDVFSEDQVTELPPHREWDLSIELWEDAKPMHGPIYSLSVREEQELKETLAKQLKAGLI